MATKQTRTKSHRRDRRRAKASDWARQGKCGMRKRIGHGPGGAPQIEIKSHVKVEHETKPLDKNEPSLTVAIGNMMAKIPVLPNSQCPRCYSENLKGDFCDDCGYGWEDYQIGRIISENDKYDLENDSSKPKPR